jgi:hypothetical protein
MQHGRTIAIEAIKNVRTGIQKGRKEKRIGITFALELMWSYSGGKLELILGLQSPKSRFGLTWNLFGTGRERLVMEVHFR